MADEPRKRMVAFGPTLTMLLNALAADHERRVTEAVQAAARERGYTLAPDGVHADLGRRAWMVPADDGDDGE